jgi:putative DNA primase/helicase
MASFAAASKEVRMTRNPTLAAALETITWGLGPVLPLHHVLPGGRCSCGKCSPTENKRGKHPIRDGGWQTASDDPEVVARWFGHDHPGANIGLATGRFVGLDVDPRHHGPVGLRALVAQHGPLPATPTQVSGSGGWHFLFAPWPGVRKSSGLIAEGVDIIWNNFIVVAPSNHASGRTYCWHPKFHPRDIKLAQAPPWLREAAGGAPANLAHATASNNAALMAHVTPPGRPIEDWVKLIREGVPDGCRNDALCGLAGLLLQRGLSVETVEILLLEWNEAACRPPEDPAVVSRLVHNIARLEQAKTKGT